MLDFLIIHLNEGETTKATAIQPISNKCKQILTKMDLPLIAGNVLLSGIGSNVIDKLVQTHKLIEQTIFTDTIIGAEPETLIDYMFNHKNNSDNKGDTVAKTIRAIQKYYWLSISYWDEICVQNIIGECAQGVLADHNMSDIDNPAQYFSLSFVCNKLRSLQEYFSDYNDFVEVIMGIMQDAIIIKTELNIDDISRIDYDNVVADNLYHWFGLKILDVHKESFSKLSIDDKIETTISTLKDSCYPNQLIPTNSSVIVINKSA